MLIPFNGLTGSLAALSLLFAGYGGWKLRDADYQRHLKKDAAAAALAQVQARATERRLETAAQEVREEVSAEKVRTEIVYRTVTKEVPVYVTQTQFARDVDARGGLPAGFVWNYNQSASNSTAPFPSGLDPDAPTEVGVSTLALTTAGNFKVCHDWRSEVEGWREWYRGVYLIWAEAYGEQLPLADEGVSDAGQ